VLPLGLPRPIALAPMEIALINDTRGSGWEAFSVHGLRTAMAGVRTTSSSRAKKAADLVRSR
jgi:hypothetical protein